MPYNKEELLKLPVEEKIQLVEDLMESMSNDEENEEELIAIAKERYEQHLKNPDEGISWEEVKKILWAKHGV